MLCIGSRTTVRTVLSFHQYTTYTTLPIICSSAQHTVSISAYSKHQCPSLDTIKFFQHLKPAQGHRSIVSELHPGSNPSAYRFRFARRKSRPRSSTRSGSGLSRRSSSMAPNCRASGRIQSLQQQLASLDQVKKYSIKAKKLPKL